MTGLIFVGMLPPNSHNPEERRFVEELSAYLPRLTYLRGIGIKSLRLHQVLSTPNRIAAMRGLPVNNGMVPHRSLLIVPFRTGPAQRFNVHWLRRQLLRLTEERPGDWIFWTRFPSPELVEALEGLPFARLVYEPIDCYAAAEDLSVAEQERVVDAELQLARRACVVAGSLTLTERFRTSPGGSHWLPFGLDLRSHKGVGGIREPIGRPRIGVAGEFDWRMDETLLGTLALQHPEWHLVLAGPRRRPWGNQLTRLANVHWLGRIPADRVRPVIADCDVTLIPYRLTDWTRACLPVKVFEYLAEGKPVVATPLPELNLLKDVVTMVPPQKFGAAILHLMSQTEPRVREHRIEAASRFTLQQRAWRAAQLLRQDVALAPTA